MIHVENISKLYINDAIIHEFEVSENKMKKRNEYRKLIKIPLKSDLVLLIFGNVFRLKKMFKSISISRLSPVITVYVVNVRLKK